MPWTSLPKASCPVHISASLWPHAHSCIACHDGRLLSTGAPYHAEKFDDFFHMVSAVHEDGATSMTQHGTAWYSPTKNRAQDDDEFRLMTSSAFDVVE